jgi:tubulin polyglutamylase TTLL9
MSTPFNVRKGGTIKFKTGFRNTIYDAMLKRGWRETDGDEWDLHWADREWVAEVFDGIHLHAWQRVNHFRNDRELCRKDLLVKNLKKFKRHLQRSNPGEGDTYDFWPTTYVLPGDYALFAEEFKRNPSSTWIMKPVGRAQGKGIFIFQKLSQISKWRSDSRYASTGGGSGGGGSVGGGTGGGAQEPDGSKKTKAEARGVDAEAYVVQRYVANPYLVAGRKFDMRIYALVTTYAPLTVWLYRGGFCRFSSARYSNNAADLENVFMHLTNVAIQKKSADYSKDEHGGKWDLRQLKLYLMSRYGVVMVDRLFNEIQMIVLRSLLAVQQVMIQDKHCFELYGYDVLFDDTFKPWLVEVNAR